MRLPEPARVSVMRKAQMRQHKAFAKVVLPRKSGKLGAKVACTSYATTYESGEVDIIFIISDVACRCRARIWLDEGRTDGRTDGVEAEPWARAGEPGGEGVARSAGPANDRSVGPREILLKGNQYD